MKIPTKTVEVCDWDVLWGYIKDGKIVVLDGSTQHQLHAFKMWVRNHKGFGIKTITLLTGGHQVTVGKAVPDVKRRYIRKA